MIECLDRNDLIPVVANVLFFMVVQFLFFKYVASKQYEQVLLSKVDFVNNLQRESTIIQKKFSKLKTEYISSIKNNALEQEKLRDINNNKLTNTYIHIPILIACLMLLHLIFIMKSKREWEDTDTLALIFVALAYCTELFFFFFVVRQYEFIGDNNIISKIVEKVLE